MAGNVPDWLRGNHKKSGTAKVSHGVQSRPIFHSEHTDSPIVKEIHMHTEAAFLADGGDPSEAELKQMGLDASNKEAAADKPGIVGGFRKLFSRFQEGNIDAPGSLAYERYGAGRGRREFENQKAFAENAKMQGDGMRDAGMVMRGEKEKKKSEGPTVMDSKSDISAKPSAEYDSGYADIDTMKKRAMVMPDILPKVDANAVPRPMGDAEDVTNPVMDRRTRVRARAERVPTPSARSETPSVRSDSGGARVIIPNNPRPPVDNDTRKTKPGSRGGNNEDRKSKPTKPAQDNETRKSKPYPAEQAVQNLGKTFKEADQAYRADPKNAAKKAERDRAYKAYEKAARELR